MKKEINKQALLETIIESSLKVIDIDEIIKAVIEKYDGHNDLDILLYELVSEGYGADDLTTYGWQDWEVYDIMNIIRKEEQ